MKFFRSMAGTLGGYSALLVGTIVFGVMAILTAWIPPAGATMTWCARTWSRLWLVASGVRVRTHLPPEVAAGDGFVFLANHSSWYDIPALLSVVPGRVRFAAKRGLFQVPILGWAMKSGGFLPVDRQDRSRAREAFAAAVEELRTGGSVLFFPEGTRSPNGELLPFQRGGFLLALKSGLRVVPVGIVGSFQVMPRSTFRVRPGRIQINFGEPLDPEAYGLRGRKLLMDDVRTQIETLSRPATAAATGDEAAAVD